MGSQEACCSGLFEGFTFQDIRFASPPGTKGVYVIRIGRRGQPVAEVIRQAAQAVEHLNWPLVGKKMLNRIKRLARIGSCPVIYIGSAGPKRTSNYTLKGRYGDFAGRHTAMYPVWALLYCGWNLEYGWTEEDTPATLEESLKQRYRQRHGGRLPLLVAK
jgi:hypothetical protein